MTNAGAGYSTTYFAQPNVFYHIEAEFNETSQYLKVNGATVLTRTYTITGTPSNNACFYYFTRHNSDSTKARMKLYRSRIWQNGILVGDFIPAIRSSNNAKCICNLVNTGFYGNGSFYYEYLN
jgi:hypothetical protein